MRKTLSQEPLHDTIMCRVGLFLLWKGDQQIWEKI